MRLRTGLRVLWRARDEVQVGTDARWAVRLSDLTPGEVELMLGLGDGLPPAELARRARSLSIGSARLALLLERLDHAQLTLPPPPTSTAGKAGKAGTARSRPARWAPDAQTWSRLLADGDGAGHVAARRQKIVGLRGAGRVGLSAAGTLAAAGVGTVLIDDLVPVTPADLGAGGYTTRDLGLARSTAAARVLRDLAPELRTTAEERTRPDVLVVVEHGAADALRARVLMSAGIVHLSIVVREADVVVGPLVRPGASPCLRCLDHHRADLDPRWPAIAAQLVGVAPATPPAEESVLAAVAGSLAAAQVLSELDGTPPSVLGACLEISLPDALPRLRRWSVHPECGCGGVPPVA